MILTPSRMKKVWINVCRCGSSPLGGAVRLLDRAPAPSERRLTCLKSLFWLYKSQYIILNAYNIVTMDPNLLRYKAGIPFGAREFPLNSVNIYSLTQDRFPL